MTRPLSLNETVRPTREALAERVFGLIPYSSPRVKEPHNPGVGTVVSVLAQLPGCLIVKFPEGERMVHADWLEPCNLGE